MLASNSLSWFFLIRGMLATVTRFLFATKSTCGRRRGRGRARVRLPALIAWSGRARGRAGCGTVVVLEVVPTNSKRVATAALADPLLRKYGAVDRRKALTHADGKKWGHPCLTEQRPRSK